MKLSDNPLLRVLVVTVLIAAGIRFVFWLLTPVWPYLLSVLTVLAIWQLWRVYRERW